MGYVKEAEYKYDSATRRWHETRYINTHCGTLGEFDIAEVVSTEPNEKLVVKTPDGIVRKVFKSECHVNEYGEYNLRRVDVADGKLGYGFPLGNRWPNGTTVTAWVPCDCKECSK